MIQIKKSQIIDDVTYFIYERANAAAAIAIAHKHNDTLTTVYAISYDIAKLKTTGALRYFEKTSLIQHILPIERLNSNVKIFQLTEDETLIHYIAEAI